MVTFIGVGFGFSHLIFGVFKLWDSNDTLLAWGFSLLGRTGATLQSLHLSSKLKTCYHKNKEKERKKVNSRKLCDEYWACVRGNICGRYMYGMSRIPISWECHTSLRSVLSEYLNCQKRWVVICSSWKPLCNDLQFNRASALVSEMCFCYHVKIHADLATT